MRKFVIGIVSHPNLSHVLSAHLIPYYCRFCIYVDYMLSDMETFQPEAAAVLEELVHSQPLQLEVTAHEEDGVPYINLFLISRDQVGHTHPTPCGVCVAIQPVYVWRYTLCMCGDTPCVCVAIHPVYVWRYTLCMCGDTPCVCVAIHPMYVWRLD